MRLLLDEQISHVIAEQLRSRGFDVVAVDERSDLRGLSDHSLLEWASSEGRAVVSNDIRHFSSIATAWAQEGRAHWGIVFSVDRRLSRARGAFGAYVRALDSLLRRVPDDDGLRDRIVWLSADD